MTGFLMGVAFAVTNGTETDGELPEVVAVLRGGVCTGALVHPEWVLTAASCWDDVDVSAGVPTAVVTNEDQVQSSAHVDVVSVVIHPEYRSAGFSPNSVGEAAGPPENNLSLARLDTLSPFPPLALNTAPLDASWVGLEATVAGYGITEFQQSGSGIKRFTTTSVVDFDDERVTTFDEGGNGSCQGDGGAPVMRFVDGDPVLFAVVSDSGMCGAEPQTPTRIDGHIAWIESVVGADEIETTAIQPFSVVCSNAVEEDGVTHALGVAPTELRCESVIASSVSDVTWSWGDGETTSTTDPRVSHVYDAEGAYDLEVCFTTDQGGTDSEHCVSQPVHICEAAAPRFDATLDKTTLTLTNTTPEQPALCVSEVVWEVYEGPDASGSLVDTSTEWEPGFELPGKGEYTVVLNVSGVAGAEAASATVKSAGCGCSSTSGAAGWVGLLAAALVLRRSRAN